MVYWMKTSLSAKEMSSSSAQIEPSPLLQYPILLGTPDGCRTHPEDIGKGFKVGE